MHVRECVNLLAEVCHRYAGSKEMGTACARHCRDPTMTQSSCSRPVSGELVASMAPGCGVMLAELGRVPSDPWLGRTATPGPALRYSTITYQVLMQRAHKELCEILVQKSPSPPLLLRVNVRGIM